MAKKVTKKNDPKVLENGAILLLIVVIATISVVVGGIIGYYGFDRTDECIITN